MRLWSLHPSLLDARGLVALWREALLAQAVLLGKTRGYQNHSQLIRFRDCADPKTQIAKYLRGVHDESIVRGYNFDASKIGSTSGDTDAILVTQGQLDYEWEHLHAKLIKRDPDWLERIQNYPRDPHPIMKVVPGEIEDWEKVPD